MVFPTYNRDSILNLMASIRQALSGRGKRYATLRQLPPEVLKGSKNIILIIIDGLGHNYLLQKQSKSFLAQSITGRMTSVFPPTTGAAMPTFLTGAAPQQHGMTGWFMYLKEVGAVTVPLPFVNRIGGGNLSYSGVHFEDIIKAKGFADTLPVSSFFVFQDDIVGSPFTLAMTQQGKRLVYTNLQGFFRQVRKAVRSHNRKKFVFAYWPGFDASCHHHGIKSKETKEHFLDIDKGVQSLIHSLRGTGTTVIVTSDHGMIDIGKKATLWLEDHPHLQDCLRLPLAGELRFPYCYLKPGKERQFLSYLRTHLKKYCMPIKSAELVRTGVYGPGKPTPELLDRVGDYVLEMKENYALKDRLVNEDKDSLIGNHGGTSEDELYVPLIVFNCL